MTAATWKPTQAVPLQECSAFLRDANGTFLRRRNNGSLKPCPHTSADGRGIVALWNPSRIVCAACADVLNDGVKGTEEDRRCDRCDTVNDTIHPFSVLASGFPRLVVMLGLCPTCAKHEGVRA